MLFKAGLVDRVRRAAHVMILCSGLSALLPLSAIAASSVTLGWDPSPGTNIAGYKIYYGAASRTYTNTVNVGSVTNATITNLISGTIYYFAATAYDTSALESAYSTEVAYTNQAIVPPTIVLSSPANGSSYAAPATVNLAAAVTANGHTITKVQFYNGATLLAEDPTAPYSFTWTNVSAGGYSLSAQAVYDSGTVASPTANVTVTNLPLPSIALTTPANGASYVAPAAISLAATVTANGHTITKVQFYNGSTLLAEDPTAPYSFTWTNVSAGGYSLTAQAVYDSGSTVASTAANVTVTNPPPTIVLTSPTNGASYSSPATIVMAASVTANGHAITKVQFYNGAALLAEDTAAPYGFAWTNVSAGTYSLTAQVVYDSGSTVASTPATSVLVVAAKPVNTPPVISAIADQTMTMDAAPLTIPFTVGDAETAASNLMLYASSTNLSLLPTNNIIFDGSDSNRTVTLTPTSGQTGEVDIAITVSDGSLTASTNFHLTVAAATQTASAVALVSPSGSLAAASTLRYMWKATPAATWYELYISSNGCVFCDKWYAATNLLVDLATGDVGVDIAGQGGGTYQWYVRGWNTIGLGPWSSAGSFSVALPGAVTLLTPVNNASSQTREPQFSWTQSFPAATWCRLYVTRNQSKYLDQWVQGATNFTPAGELPGGNYSWWVQTYNGSGLGSWSTNGSFTVPVAVPGVVALTSLADGGSVLPNLKQLYTWKADTAATWYELYVVQNGKVLCDKWVTLSNSVAQIGSGTFAVEIGGHTGGSYQWYVRGWSVDGLGSWSAAGSYTMAAVPPPGAVTLLTPANNATGQIRQPEFSWTASSPAASWYYVYVERNGIKYLDQWVEEVTTNWVPSTGLAGGDYGWRVLPWSEAGFGPWSTNYTFNVPIAVPGALTLVSPSGSLAAGATQRYVWQLDTAATWYELYVTKDGRELDHQWLTLSNSVVDSATGNFAVDVVGHDSGTYQWYVRGWSPDGLGPWSSAGNFTVAIPGPVTLLTPTNTASIQDRRPEFSWSQSTPAATLFYLNISHSGSNYLHQWIEGETNWTPTVDLPGGTYTWAVQTWNPDGLGSWSQIATFTNQVVMPTNIDLVSPTGSVPVSPTQRYVWQADPAATWYELYITRNGSEFLDQWYASTNSVVDITIGDFAVDVSGHGTGSYQWQVRGWNVDGFGPWSSALNFRE